MFLKSMDASDKVKSAQLICEMMEEIVQEVGEENVVQIVTDNAANYMAAGRLFESRHPTIFWSSCAAHCLDLMLEDIGKLQWIQEVVDQGKIHNQIHLQPHKYPFHHESIHIRQETCSFWGDEICNRFHLLAICSRAKS